MRGRLTDFTLLEPVAPAAVRALPADFDCDAADAYIDAPAAPEVTECRGCDPVACNRLIRAEGRTVKPDCATFLVMDGATSAPTVAERILATLRKDGPQTLQDLTGRLNVKYFTLRHYADQLRAAGCIVDAGWRPKRRGRAKVYALGSAPLPPPAPAPALPVTQAPSSIVVVNNSRVLDALRRGGPAAVSDLASVTGLHATTVADRLKVLAAAGAVRQGAVVERVAEGFHNRRYKVQLWEATKDA